MERATILLCLFGFFKELRPSEPFLTPYLKGPDKNLTEEQVTNEIYPVWTYTYFPALLVVFLLTDYLRYKPVIIFEGFTLILTWVILVWGQGVVMMQLMQVTYGLSTAAEIGYFSYIYSVVPQDRYRKVTGYNRSIVLVGRFAAAVVAQVLVSTNLVGYFALNCFSLGSVSIAFILGFTLPTARKSLFFHKDEPNHKQLLDVASKGDIAGRLTQENQEDGSKIVEDTHSRSDSSQGRGNLLASDRHYGEDTVLCVDGDSTAPTDNKETVYNFEPEESAVDLKTSRCCQRKFTCLTTLKQLGCNLREAYSSEVILAWSVFWAFAKCGNSQAGNYIQNLWDIISPSSQHSVYNGAVEAVTMLAGALVSLLMGHVKLNWSVVGEMTLGVVSLGMSALLFAMATTDNIWVCYVCYVFYRTAYQALITIATFEVAKNLDKALYALLFGMNTFAALALQTALTAVVVDRRVLATPVTAQYNVYGAYFCAIAAAYLLKSVFTCTRAGWRESWRNRWVTAVPDDDGSTAE